MGDLIELWQWLRRESRSFRTNERKNSFHDQIVYIICVVDLDSCVLLSFTKFKVQLLLYFVSFTYRSQQTIGCVG